MVKYLHLLSAIKIHTTFHLSPLGFKAQDGRSPFRMYDCHGCSDTRVKDKHKGAIVVSLCPTAPNRQQKIKLSRCPSGNAESSQGGSHTS